MFDAAMEPSSAPFYRLFGIFELARMILDYVDDLTRIPPTCRLLNEYVKVMKADCMKGSPAGTKKLQEHSPNASVALSPFIKLLLQHTSQFSNDIKKEDGKNPSFLLPAWLLDAANRDWRKDTTKPWTMFATNPPVTKVHLLFSRLCWTNTLCMEDEPLFLQIDDPKGITFASIVRALRSKGSAYRRLFTIIVDFLEDRDTPLGWLEHALPLVERMDVEAQLVYKGMFGRAWPKSLTGAGRAVRFPSRKWT